MDPAALHRLEEKLDTLRDAVLQLATRFENFPDLQKQVADHEKRMTALESLEVKKYDERLDRLEGQVASFRGWILGATAVAMAVGSIVAWTFANMADKL